MNTIHLYDALLTFKAHTHTQTHNITHTHTDTYTQTHTHTNTLPATLDPLKSCVAIGGDVPLRLL